MKYKQVAITLAILTSILTSGIASAYAYDGKYQKNRKRKNVSIEKQEKILETFENGDYFAWREMVGEKSDIVQVVTKDQFDKFVKARDLARSTNYDEALAISRELGADLEKEAEKILDSTEIDDKLLKEAEEAKLALNTIHSI